MLVQEILKNKEFSSEDRVIIMDNLLLILIICLYDTSKFQNLMGQFENISEDQTPFDL